MKIVEKIEIHRFRSISNESIETDEINIFSGINNSGKSNILKALNLYFHSRSSFDQQFDFVQDYNQAFTGHAGGKRAIEIVLHFGGHGAAALSAPFSIARTFEVGQDRKTVYSSTDASIQKRLKDNDGNTNRQFTTFLNRIEYFYVPAVREKKFVQSLFLNFEKLIEYDSGKEFKENIDALSRILKKKSEEISVDFERFIELPTRAALSTKITDILSTVEINVKPGIRITKKTPSGTKPVDVEVSLFSSGDGILMSYLAYFLAHVCKKISNKTFIWGFEEPENSLEYSKVQKLSEEFYEVFRDNAQIFITTHSPAFINLKDHEGVNFYRVFTRPNDDRQASEIRTINEIRGKQQNLFASGKIDTPEYKKLSDELNFVEFSREIEFAVKRVQNEERALIEAKSKFEKENAELLRLKPKRIFICEDSDTRTTMLWKHLLKLYGLKDIRVISSEGCTNTFVEDGVRYQKRLGSSYNPKVFRQIDRDGLTDEQIEYVGQNIYKKAAKELSYQYRFIPVNEVENFAVLLDGVFSRSYWEEYRIELEDKFSICANSTCQRFASIFRDEPLFNYHGNAAVTQPMKDFARSDWRKYFPGKDICAKVPNFNAITVLESKAINELPVELRQFMSEVKEFFVS